MALQDQHLADLHRSARELGVPRYRMLGRDELIEAIEERDQGGGAAGGREEAVDAGLERPRHEPDREDSGDEDEEEPEADEAEAEEAEEPPVETEPVTGVLDRMPQGY